MAQSVSEKVFALIKDTVEACGVRLWDVKFVKEGVNWYLRVIIDNDAGISIDDCTEVHHSIDPILDDADPIEQSYYLEVCSPGLERELTRNEHFSLVCGQKVKVKLYKARDGVKEFSGILKSGDREKVVLSIDEKDTEFIGSEISVCRLDDADF